MRFFEFKINEGSGFRASVPGEIYTDRDGTEYQFVVWDYQYPNNANGFEDFQATLDAADKITRANPNIEIRWINNPPASNKPRSFGFAKFKSAEGNKELWIGKFFSAVNPNNTIKDGEASAVNLTSQSAKSAGVKATAAMQPGQLGIADGRLRSLGAIQKLITNHPQGQQLNNALNQAASNQPIVFPGLAGSQSAIQDDFCEVLSPVAIINKHNVVNGPLDNALNDIFKTNEVKDAQISFPSGQNNPLIDSFVVKGGIKMGISHKGKAGAKASITNIWDAKEQAAKTETGRAYMEKYPAAVEILDICKTETAIQQPITLAEKFGIINSVEASAMKEIMANPRAPEKKLEGNKDNPKMIMTKPTPNDLAKIPESLARIFSLKGYRAGSYVSFICLANIAYQVAEYINNDKEIDFGEAIRSFLNSSAMIQATSIVGKSKEDAILKSIGIVYPPDFKEKASISASPYYGTEAKTKFAFSLPKT